MAGQAKALKAETMLQVAEIEINATARNSYIWAAKALMKEAGE
jgi:alkyl sulfatase BDS1-like metallo-beta-lactamase superfamily hydrolase